MKIEEKFFEEFGIEPKYTFDDVGCTKEKCKYQDRPEDKYFPDEECPCMDGDIRNCISPNVKHYPEITPAIMLGLIDIIIKHFMTDAVTFAFNVNHQEYGVGVEFITEFAHEKPDIKTAYGKTLEECVINICKELKSSITQEVQELFGIEVKG